MSRPTASIDLLSSSVRADIFAAYDELRRIGPVVWNPRMGCWMVLGYTEARAVLTDYSRFTSTLARPKSESLFGGPTMIFSDPPLHSVYRSHVSAHLGACPEPTQPTTILSQAERLVHEATNAPIVDVIASIASPLSVTIITEVLGTPVEDRVELKTHSDAIVSVGLDGGSTARERREAGVALHRYFRDRIVSGDGHAGLLREFAEHNVRTDNEELQHLAATCVMLLVAGHETTTSLIGNVVYALATHREVWSTLREDPAMAPRIIDEALRYDGPVHALRRRAIADVNLGGTTLAVGSHVMVLVAAANRDPSAFADPDAFIVDRPRRKRHLAFGSGLHFCVGSNIGREEACAVALALTRRVASIDLAPKAQLEYLPSLFVRGLSALPVAIQR